ncbi:probable E3 ubiquitin-protein ligase HERC4 [Neocloeon triangulifer]|uniref:probable E3 ubiquitin-protein ligase HERC4 n=1 Tax=Neocloeon triangulifer TaxID=2078957 RepID=UPI00286EEDC8|nr:probable E3 ubiquitin-protein ligase HERC4 [Neocloeon triangulifer]
MASITTPFLRSPFSFAILHNFAGFSSIRSKISSHISGFHHSPVKIIIMDETAVVMLECDICQKPCCSRQSLESHVKTHVKKKKLSQENRAVSAYYLGSNAFGQCCRAENLVCWKPVLLSDDISLLCSSFGSIAWFDSNKEKLQFQGFKDNLGKNEITLNAPKEICSELSWASNTVYGISRNNIFKLLPDNTWIEVDSNVVQRLKSTEESPKILGTMGKYIYCLTEKGRIWNIMGEDLEKAMVQIPGTVTSFSCGEEHCVAATQEREVFSWGNSLKGQLGRGTLQEEDFPTRIPALGGLKIAQVECGKWHNVVLTEDGDLYVWGWNKHGQLGIPCPDFENLETFDMSTTVLAEPTLLDFPIGVRQISCGSAHTLLLADDYTVWGCGFAKFGQLGFQNDKDKIDGLTQVSLLNGKVNRVQAKYWSSVFFVEKS